MAIFKKGTPSVGRVPSGIAVSINVGRVPVATAFGQRASTAFGAPGLSATLHVGSAYATAAFGTVSVDNGTNILPVGLVVGTTPTHAPMAIPFGAPMPVAFGAAAASLTIYSGVASVAHFSSPPIIVPSGQPRSAAFGAPTITVGNPVPLNVAGGTAATTATFGNVPLAIPVGRPQSFGFGNESVVVPFGRPMTTAVGAPDVQMAAAAPIPAPAPTTIAGLGLGYAEKTFSELVDEWNRITRQRRKLEDQAKRLDKEKASAERRRQTAVVDLTTERRLEKMLVTANKALMTLEERERQLIAHVRAFQVNTAEMSAANRRALAAIESNYEAALREDDEAAILVLL